MTEQFSRCLMWFQMLHCGSFRDAADWTEVPTEKIDRSQEKVFLPKSVPNEDNMNVS